MENAPQDPPAKPSRAEKRLGTRIIAGAFITLASVFIGLSALQIIPQVFAAGAEPLAGEGLTQGAAPECAGGISTLAGALDRALSSAVRERGTSEQAAVAVFEANLTPEWANEQRVFARCTETPHGQEAFAALLRLRQADENFVRKSVVEIAPLRREVAAYSSH